MGLGAGVGTGGRFLGVLPPSCPSIRGSGSSQRPWPYLSEREGCSDSRRCFLAFGIGGITPTEITHFGNNSRAVTAGCVCVPLCVPAGISAGTEPPSSVQIKDLGAHGVLLVVVCVCVFLLLLFYFFVTSSEKLSRSSLLPHC